jgi:2-methylcitrate dehydratase PrpD
MMPLTRRVGEFIAGMDFPALPQAAVATARNGLTDLAAVTILGRDMPVVRLLKSMATTLRRGGEARLCFATDGASAVEAALINGAAGHALDYDDIGIGVHPAHPSVVLGSAVLSEGEAMGASGRAVIAAYVTGYEVWVELARRDRTPHHVKGSHPTATFGAVAAAAACGRLRGLDARRAGNAVAIAASQAGGIVANYGSMTKPFHAGRAAQVGVYSARLAAAGMTAAADALENPKGFLHAVSPKGEVDVESPPEFGRTWWILRHGLGFKLYPMCYGTHRSLDGMLALLREHDFAAADVAEIEVEMGPVQLVSLVNHDPTTGLEGKFSEEFAMAMAVIAQRATLAEVSDEFVARPDVRALMQKVRITIVEGADTAGPGGSPLDRIIVTLRNGRRLERRLEHPRGHPQRPMGADVLWAKFADCVRGALEENAARRLFDRLQSLDRMESFAELPRIEAGAPAFAT